jgi:hypothetical protein
MDLPRESLDIPVEQQDRITKYVQRRTNEGRKRFERYIQCLKKQGYTDEQIETIVD